MGTCCSDLNKLADDELHEAHPNPTPADPLMRSVDGMYMDVGLIEEE